MTALWVEITETRGSVPRDPGTAMQVTAQGIAGTIGGGTLEYQAIATARKMLGNGQTRHSETLPLGPNLGQCCGGVVTLQYTDEPRQTDEMSAVDWPLAGLPTVPQKLWLWGAGHVGRAVVRAAPPQAFDIQWIDSATDRFPTQVPKHVSALPTADMPRLAPHAPQDAHHLIFTYAHDIDLALCAALLRRGAASIGLIGSATKWARFRKRLAATGLDPAPITCPIGDKRLGKSPDQIAKGVVADLLALPQPEAHL
ncbi:xanthine dehydrogenase accessory protein XdhC [Sulfitobacter sp. M57]|uniref:xanthine dehydrogenase accessory protein XdhC n=1 Tax=unclassified Sulfitobacter TaxID=196795 RepID=UPI0023E27899|nr:MULTISPECIES: xanthine dehydrogenase accessory protein XdhC [unclassified Sulfitobacter]MDF3415811.1 xanthine dehydrogenase accessory protein XdhC [Sulfitobacter sp. KE5]MDF3423291.1 xanthine dehydrogenase accessory protein XdhC [Sulfitobacter sp. KE43]MDF3434357.1 xanthine dehydrogenase accessory protein XdhC [Sulfitobacter sp. KE42]MDF3459997.1 xanthine dehydrogenase accessory protein XdhC [Sulfitobacter sp. S74]MDF3463895.1 xanthine dehydrogenase accessory protein XdhC [Sulfitobacter sp.